MQKRLRHALEAQKIWKASIIHFKIKIMHKYSLFLIIVCFLVHRDGQGMHATRVHTRASNPRVY